MFEDGEDSAQAFAHPRWNLGADEAARLGPAAAGAASPFTSPPPTPTVRRPGPGCAPTSGNCARSSPRDCRRSASRTAATEPTSSKSISPTSTASTPPVDSRRGAPGRERPVRVGRRLVRARQLQNPLGCGVQWPLRGAALGRAVPGPVALSTAGRTPAAVTRCRSPSRSTASSPLRPLPRHPRSTAGEPRPDACGLSAPTVSPACIPYARRTWSDPSAQGSGTDAGAGAQTEGAARSSASSAGTPPTGVRCSPRSRSSRRPACASGQGLQRRTGRRGRATAAGVEEPPAAVFVARREGSGARQSLCDLPAADRAPGRAGEDAVLPGAWGGAGHVFGSKVSRMADAV